MKTYTFEKQVNSEKLRLELISAGFACLGMLTENDGKITTIYFSDTEMKDPTSIVNTHVFVEYREIDWQKEWKEAKTDAERILVLAKSSGIVPLTIEEKETGVVVI